MGGCVSQEIIYGRSMIDQPTCEMLYHGSPSDINDEQLLVHENKLINDPVLFVSEKKWLALCFANKKWGTDEICVGIIEGKPIILELLPGSFKKYYKYRSGFLYEVNNNGEFHGDCSLSFSGIEWISNKNQTIANKFIVFDIWKALRLEATGGEVELVKYKKNSTSYDNYKKILFGNKKKVEYIDEPDLSDDLSSVKDCKKN